ncbi:MAG TPA: hypothetical protein VFF00_01755 [Candidatus Elarobacter sp.]|nr:hypothetical protein [Candidatus Elarobacter sp.]
MSEECSANNIGGDNDAGFKRVMIGAGVGAGLGVVAGIGATAGVAGPLWGAGLVILFTAVAVAIVGGAIAQVVAWFTRLKTQNPATITIHGEPRCAGKNPWGIQPWTDGDWTTNIGPTPADPTSLRLAFPTDLALSPGVTDPMVEIRTRAAPGSGLAKAFMSFNESGCSPATPGNCITPILHCEISSHVGSYSVVGGMVGAVAGAVAGFILGAGVICGLLGAFTFGLGALLCLVVAAIVGAILAAVGYFVGAAVGSVAGAIADAVTDFDKNGSFIEANRGCILFVTGTWVTDLSHQHNEIHDIQSVGIVECGVGSSSNPLTIAGAVGTGRHPSGEDP